MTRNADLPEELVECLENYRDGRCPELAACVFEELMARSHCAESDTERCLYRLLPRNWLGEDRRRRDLPSPRLVSCTEERGCPSAGVDRHSIDEPTRPEKLVGRTLRLVHDLARQGRS